MFFAESLVYNGTKDSNKSTRLCFLLLPNRTFGQSIQWKSVCQSSNNTFFKRKERRIGTVVVRPVFMSLCLKKRYDRHVRNTHTAILSNI